MLKMPNTKENSRINGALKYLKAFLIVLVMFLIGIERDFIFVSINKILDSINKNQSYGLFFLEEKFKLISYVSLLSIKWYLTFFFYLIYLGFACLSIHVLFKKKIYIYWTIGFFFSVLFSAFVFMAIGYFLNDYAME